MMAGHWDQVAVVMLFTFIAGLIWDAGRKAEKLSSLERWRDEVRQEVKAMTTGIAELKGLLTGRGHHGDHD